MMITTIDKVITFRFQLVKWQVIGTYHTEWLLVIEDLTTLKEYLKHRYVILLEAYFKIKNKTTFDHYWGNDQLAIGTALESTEGRETIIDDYLCIAKTILSTYSNIFLDRGKVLVTETHTILPILEYEVLKNKSNNELIWPTNIYTKQDISITKWPNGKHYYARIGKLDVKDEDGDMKWSSAEEAEEQANIFLNNLDTKREKYE